MIAVRNVLKNDLKRYHQIVQMIPFGGIVLELKGNNIKVAAINEAAISILNIKKSSAQIQDKYLSSVSNLLYTSDNFIKNINKSLKEKCKTHCTIFEKKGSTTFKFLDIKISFLNSSFLFVSIKDNTKNIKLSNIVDKTFLHIELIGELTNLLSDSISIDEMIKIACDRLKEIHNLYFSDAWLRIKDGEKDEIEAVYTNFNKTILKAAEKIVGVKYIGLKTPIIEGSTWYPVYHQRESTIHRDNDIVKVIADFQGPENKTSRSLAPLIAKMSGSKFVLLVPIEGTKEVIGHMGFDAIDFIEEIDIQLLKLAVDKVSTIIELKRSVNQQKELTLQLQQSQKLEAVGQLAGGIAHDFNNLLTGIMGNTQLLQMETTPDTTLDKLLGEIYETSQKAAKLVKQLLAYSRKQVLSKNIINVKDLITDTFSMLERTLSDNINIILEFNNDDPFIYADSSQIDQIMVNLAVNAKDAMPNGGTITVSTGVIQSDVELCKKMNIKFQPYVNIRISDTGYGMSKEVLSNIFEPFFTTKKLGEGTGLGLSMVYGITKQHKGAILADSTLNKGTTFNIYLPLVDSPEKLKQPKSVSSIPPPPLESIMIIDDDSIARKTTCKILSKFGYKTFCASSGEEALLILQHNKTLDLLITDIMMPKQNGFAVADLFKEKFPQIKTLYISGYSKEILKNRNDDFNSSAFLQKPYSAKELKFKIYEIINTDD
ncbi:MAG: response regulator [Deltaproteobacteria bacterium]|nr:response regulator [Deltaproteobacteria bacterium]